MPTRDFSKRKSRIGFVDIEMRDEDNNPVYKRRGKKLGDGIKEFEDFLEKKFGIKGFSAYEETPKKKKKKENFF